MWRASFEKMQKMAQETNERYSVLVEEVSRAESVTPASMLTALPNAFPQRRQLFEAPKEEGGAVPSRQTMGLEDPWMSLCGGEARDQPQSSTNKHGQGERPSPESSILLDTYISDTIIGNRS